MVQKFISGNFPSVYKYLNDHAQLRIVIIINQNTVVESSSSHSLTEVFVGKRKEK